MKMRTVLALAMVLAGAFWFYAASRSGAVYPPFLNSVLPLGTGRAVALAEAPPQTSFGSEETRDISIYKRVSPSVVNVTSQIIQYDLLWGPVPASGQGSGFFINRDGYILTNYHVIAGARRLTVTWTPKKDQSRQFPATVVGSAPELDLAVIKIAATSLPPVMLGDSANLQVGQRVLAIGNPYGLPGTMTQGIISSIRSVREGQQENGRPGADIEGAIQTDAPINPGNSGGPLLNSLGEVIGIDTMIYSQTGSNIGIGFAIPINSAKAVLQQLITTGRVQTISLGVQSFPVSPDVAQQLGLSVNHGLVVLGVRPGSLAERAGLQVGNQPGYIGNTPVRFGGDIILAANGEPLQDQGQLSNILLLQKPGSTVTLTVLRNGRQVQVPITLGTER
ncbi:MAG TPA: trypsin-like peptidase domain-containing protein [Terriglobales bacterium]|nr:trypsin-like peptidase domain-containing protein [Terriglobales bacterium]